MRSFVFAECFAIGMLYSEKNELKVNYPMHRTSQIPGRVGSLLAAGILPLGTSLGENSPKRAGRNLVTWSEVVATASYHQENN